MKRFLPYLPLLIGGLSACDRSTTAPTDATPSGVHFTVVSGNGQSAPVNTQLASPLRARVTNALNQPMAHYTVNFVVTSGDGSVFGEAEETNANGFVDETWTLGPRLGKQTIDVRAVNPNTGVQETFGHFTARGLPPHHIPVVLINNVGLAIMNADGSNFHQLTSNPADVFPGALQDAPDLSPDHAQIIFTSARSGSQQIWRINADGTGLTQLTTAAGANRSAQWSFDGLFIAYTHAGPDSVPDIFVMTSSGNTFDQLTFGKGARYPSWSPDGIRIAFEGGIITADEVYVVTFDFESIITDGSNIKQLTFTTNGINAVPSWSPDGEHILFAAQARIGGAGLFVMDADGNNQRVIPGTGAVSEFVRPSWSPDGTLIGSSLGLMNADGTGLVQINGGAEGAFPWR